jgi:hypothetical protein
MELFLLRCSHSKQKTPSAASRSACMDSIAEYYDSDSDA